MDPNTELQIAQAVLSELRNSTSAITDAASQAGTYGFQLMVAGTRFSGIASIISLAVFLIATYLVFWKCWIPYIKSWQDEEAQLLGGVFGGIVILFALIIMSDMLFNAIMSIAIPEYVVVNKLIELAATAV